MGDQDMKNWKYADKQIAHAALVSSSLPPERTNDLITDSVNVRRLSA